MSTPGFFFVCVCVFAIICLFVCFSNNGVSVLLLNPTFALAGGSNPGEARWVRTPVLLHLFWLTHSSPTYRLRLTHFILVQNAKFFLFTFLFKFLVWCEKKYRSVLSSQLFLSQANSDASYLLQWAGNGQQFALEKHIYRSWSKCKQEVLCLTYMKCPVVDPLSLLLRNNWSSLAKYT